MDWKTLFARITPDFHWIFSNLYMKIVSKTYNKPMVNLAPSFVAGGGLNNSINVIARTNERERKPSTCFDPRPA